MTKITTRALAAIEANDFDRLPGGVFRRAYVKSFASEVGLDPDEIGRAYVEVFEPDPVPEPASTPAIDFADRFFTRRALGLTVLAGAGILAVALMFGRPEPRAAAEPEPGEEGALSAAADDERDLPPLRLEIRFDGPCWISVNADGRSVARRLLQAGDRLVIDARETINLNLGDAGAVTYTLNGRQGRPLGGDGEVVNVDITPKNYERLYR